MMVRFFISEIIIETREYEVDADSKVEALRKFLDDHKDVKDLDSGESFPFERRDEFKSTIVNKPQFHEFDKEQLKKIYRLTNLSEPHCPECFSDNIKIRKEDGFIVCKQCNYSPELFQKRADNLNAYLDNNRESLE